MTPFEDWKAKAQEADMLQEAVRCGAKLKRSGQENSGPCPACGGRDRFSVNTAKGKWHCRGYGGGADAIGMVQHIAGLSFKEAVEAITGEPCPTGPARPVTDAEKAERNRRRIAAEDARRDRGAQEAAREQDTREAAQRIWDAAKPIDGTLAQTYLIARGIPAFASDVLRFHGGLPYPGKRKPYPALVCRVDDVAGDLCAVWRIFLREDGRKADVPNAKLGLGPAGGGAVRIGGYGKKIGLAEGAESSLGAWHLIGRQYPVWAALSTSGLVGIELPLSVEHVVIFPDGDRPLRKHGKEYVPTIPPGRKAAEALAGRIDADGIKVTIAAEPAMGRDYLDLWQEMAGETA